MEEIQIGLNIFISRRKGGLFASLQDTDGLLITTETLSPIILFLE